MKLFGGLAMLTISLPPMLVLAVDQLHRQMSDHPAMRGFVRGLGLAVAGNILAVMVTLCNTSGGDARSLLIVLASIELGVTRRVPVVVGSA